MKIEKVLLNRFENNILQYCELFNINEEKYIYDLGNYNDLSDMRLRIIDNINERIFNKFNSIIIIDIELSEKILKKGFVEIKKNISFENFTFVKKEKGFLFGFNFNNYDEIKSFIKIIDSNNGIILTNLNEEDK